MNRFSFALAFALAFAAFASAASAADAPAKKVDFTKDIAPIFKASCVKCHGVDAAKPDKKPAAKFRLDDKDAAFKGGKVGKDIVAGNSKDSLLYKLLNGPVTLEDDKEVDPMPKAKKGEKWKPLPADQVALIQQWIDQGADWPAAK